ncbi:MAG TPA: hypothetical protein VHY84_11805 [Bryobacteraceae bacterium]|nr:hypothetical protein [Bryobacteraceae bacterium]
MHKQFTDASDLADTLPRTCASLYHYQEFGGTVTLAVAIFIWVIEVFVGR